MYEVEQKTAFKQTLSKTTGLKQFASIEKRIGDFEDKYQKGLSKFYPGEIVEFMDSLMFTRPAVIKQYLSVLKKYFQFCGQVTCDNIYLENIHLSEAIKHDLYPSFGALLDPIEKQAVNLEGGLVLPALAFAWLGLTPEQVCNLRVNDVDLKKGLIFVDGNKVHQIEIKSDSILALLRRYRNINATYRDLSSNSGTVVYTPIESEYFLRKLASSATQRKSAQYASNSLRTALTRAQEQLEENGIKCNLVYKDIMLCGELEKVRFLEVSGIDVIKEKKLVRSCFSSSYTDSDALYLYQEYKKAFNLH